MALLPSAEIATEWPCLATPTAPVPTSLLPCWVQTVPFAGLSGREREVDRLAQSINRCIDFGAQSALLRPIASSSPAFFGSRRLPSDIPQYRRVFRYASVVAWCSLPLEHL